MKYLSEFRNSNAVNSTLDELKASITNEWCIMEVCGGQTHSLLKSGLLDLLPKKINLLHGPGCPVCVTSVSVIDKVIYLALEYNVTVCTFGDMMRVPGSSSDLMLAKSMGADIRMVYSPLDALEIAKQNPEKDVVFLAIGFETTAPSTALAVRLASETGVNNFSILAAHVLVIPALEALLSSPDCQIQGLIAPGHVCAITGYSEYEQISQKYNIPIVVAGFESVDLALGIKALIDLLESGSAMVANSYKRGVQFEGNKTAVKLMNTIYETVDQVWRGIGMIPQSGLKLREKYAKFDAELNFMIPDLESHESEVCISGAVLKGERKPYECSAFGKECSPSHPLGATMVSSEGACAAYYKYWSLGSRRGHDAMSD